MTNFVEWRNLPNFDDFVYAVKAFVKQTKKWEVRAYDGHTFYSAMPHGDISATCDNGDGGIDITHFMAEKPTMAQIRQAYQDEIAYLVEYAEALAASNELEDDINLVLSELDALADEAKKGHGKKRKK